MSETTTISIEVSTATAEQLDALARSTNRSPAVLARQALDQFLEVEAWHKQAIDEAIAEADADGPLIAHEDMVRWLQSWGTDNELPPPEATTQPRNAWRSLGRRLPEMTSGGFAPRSPSTTRRPPAVPPIASSKPLGD